MEPGTAYKRNWHIDVIAEHLEAVTRHDIQNLLINIPPGCMKSLSVCVFWPAWVWITHPDQRWMFASYNFDLSLRDSVKCRTLIQSPWYQARWGHHFKLSTDQNQKERFSNDRSGFRLATSVAGQGTGERVHVVVADDPHKAQDAGSVVALDNAWRWWSETIPSRGADPKTFSRVVIMQRLHEADLSGRILDAMRRDGTTYDVLCLPMRYEPTTYVTSIGWKDPRIQPDELLWPDHFGEKEVKRLEAELGNAAAGQLQQRPAPVGGAIYQKAWWDKGRNRYKSTDRRLVNLCVGRWLFLDTALEDKEDNAYSAMSVVEMLPDYRILIRYAWRERVIFPLLVSTIAREARRLNADEKLRGVIIENKSSGTSAIQTLHMGTEGWLARLIVAFNPVGSKEYRARQASLWCDRDCVLLPEPDEAVPWLFDYENELFTFPASTFKDWADTFSMGILYLENFLAQGWEARNRHEPP